MYEKFFGFTARPFLPAPRADRCHSTQLMECARQTLVRSIERGEGPGLLIGPSGTGKTLLCQLLAQEFADRFAVVQLTSGRLATRAALLQAVLYELGLPYRGMDEGELRLALVDFLEPREGGESGLLLLVDEAQTLPLRLLEEIRLITNLVRDGQPRVRVVLAGSPQLEERFASPKLSAFAQRLAARCYLDALDSQETAAYVRAEIKAVGGDPIQLANDDTLRSVYRASDGIPRLINQVCDHALVLASLGGSRVLSSEAIEEAWADLQQLPTPWSAGARATTEGGVIEFGQLDDAADDVPEAIPFRSQSTKPLHLAPTEDLAGAESGEDDERASACRGNSMLAGGTRSTRFTEVELDFPEFGDPHTEQFEEEEVVLDRYPLEVELFADAPRVSSWESRQLASILAECGVGTLATEQNDNAITLNFGIAPMQVEHDDESTIGCQPVSSFAATDVLLTMPPNFAIPAESREAVVASFPLAENLLESATQRESSFWAGAKAAGDEPQLIVIEDEVPHSDRQPPRRRPYRQLFAKLRRG
ncbi:MAG: AAA family ATPase [Pirellulales bacterium]